MANSSLHLGVKRNKVYTCSFKVSEINDTFCRSVGHTEENTERKGAMIESSTRCKRFEEKKTLDSVTPCVIINDSFPPKSRDTQSFCQRGRLSTFDQRKREKVSCEVDFQEKRLFMIREPHYNYTTMIQKEEHFM